MRSVTHHKGDILVALFVIACVAMLLIPLPTALLDLLLVVNLSVSLLLLIVALYIPSAVSLLAFPSLLLLTTLFRLGLNVASTRLILSQADAGRVIEAFGRFLVQGEVAVGLIVFTVITIVNFIVIARGASRISEVAARFTLDALPGKQGAIDADLRAGLLTPAEARRRRDDVRKESQLYGAMDGAMRFVQGDAIAGFLIIAVNIVGGMYRGLSQGQGFADAVQTYTVLTVGDGLVSQLPAILMSTCAGIVVTRVSSGENTTLGTDVGQQLFARPTALIFAGCLLLGMGLLPGLPPTPFVLVAVSLLGAGFLLRRTPAPEVVGVTSALPGGRALRALPSGEEEDLELPLVMAMDEGYLYRLFAQREAFYRERWANLRAEFSQEVGVQVPSLDFAARAQTATPGFELQVNGIVVDRGTLPMDSVFVEMNPAHAAMLGFQVRAEVSHPVTGSAAFWMPDSLVLRKMAEAAGLRVFDPIEYLFLRLLVFVQDHPEEVFTVAEVHDQLKRLEKRHPGLLADLLQKEVVSLANLAQVFQAIVRCGGSVRDVKQLVEAVAAYVGRAGQSISDAQAAFDLTELIQAVRLARRRQLVGGVTVRPNQLRVVVLGNRLAEVLEGCDPPAPGAALALEHGSVESALQAVRGVVEPVRLRGLLPLAVLCRAELSAQAAGLLRTLPRGVRVVCYEELYAGLQVEQVGIWELPESAAS